MPPKPAAKAAPVAAAPAPLDPEAEAERRLLIEQCKALKMARIHEESQLAQFYEEKERLNALWVSAKGEAEEAKSRLRAKERQREEKAEEMGVELKIYKQRIKHLLFEHQAEATEARTEGITALKLAQEGHRDGELQLKADKRDLKAVVREMETSHEDFLKAMKMEHDRGITDLRLEFERETREMAATYEDRMVRAREELNRSREDTIRAIEKRKTKHISALVATHEKAFADIKLYYNEITHSNLDLIKTLKDEVEELRTKEALHERNMFSIAQENKKMSEPMRKAIEEVKRLKEERETYHRDLQDLAETKAHILVEQDKLENLRWEHEILEQRYNRLAVERDSLYEKFQQALHDVKQKTGFKHLLLEKRLAAAAEEVERQTVTLSEVLAAARLDPAVLGRLEKQLADVAKMKDDAIKELEGELARVASAHNGVVDKYMRKLAEYGIPREELGFYPMSAAEIITAAAARAGPGASAGGTGGGGGAGVATAGAGRVR